MIRHDKHVKNLVQRLQEYNRYDWIKTHVEYKIGSYEGEVDVLAYDSKNDTFHFYEVKCSNRYTKAVEQYNRFKNAHPQIKTMGVMYTPKGVRRM